MKLGIVRQRFSLLLAGLLFLGIASGLFAYQRRAPGGDQDDDEGDMPLGVKQKVEWTFARFHYDMAYGNFR